MYRFASTWDRRDGIAGPLDEFTRHEVINDGYHRKLRYVQRASDVIDPGLFDTAQIEINELCTRRVELTGNVHVRPPEIR